VAAIGPATAAALAEHGIPVTTVTEPGAEHGRGLVAALIAAEHGARQVDEATPLAGRRVLYPGSDRARSQVPDDLRAAGATVDVVEAYRNRPDLALARTLAQALRAGGLDGLLITSPSNVEALVTAAGADWPGLLDRVRVVAIGPTTSAELRARGRPPDAEARSRDPHELARALAGTDNEIEGQEPRSHDRVSNE